MFFSTLKSNSLGVFGQITKGIKSTTNVINLKDYINWDYADGKQENQEKIVANYKENLPLKTTFNQREKSMILQDFGDILKNEPGKFKSLITSLKSVPDSVKIRSIVIYLLKQIYYFTSNSNLKFIKSNPSFMQKYCGYDFIKVAEILTENFKSLKLDIKT